MLDKRSLLLYAVTDRNVLKGGITLEDAVRRALEGGVTMLQLREKDAAYDDFVQSALRIKTICRQYNVPLIINDNIDVCIASGADGVHLGQGDTPADSARRLLGDDKIIGVTAKTLEQADKAYRDGADYIGSGAIFGTSTKADAKNMDINTLKTITSHSRLPVVAIGGISCDNILNLKDTNISGAAVVSGIFASYDITAAAKDLFNKISSIVK